MTVLLSLVGNDDYETRSQDNRVFGCCGARCAYGVCCLGWCAASWCIGRLDSRLRGNDVSGCGPAVRDGADDVMQVAGDGVAWCGADVGVAGGCDTV